MKRILLLLFGILPLTMLVSCSCQHPDSVECQMNHAGVLLQDAQDSVDQWGKVSVSDLMLIENTGQFKINYDEDVSNYVAAARGNVAGTSSSANATSQFTSLSANANITSPVSAGAPPASGQSNAAAGTVPTPAEPALSNAPQPIASIIPTTDEGTAVQKGINDKMSEMILKFMANPDLGSNNQKIVFGVMQVTCQPGVKTRKSYAANVNVSIKYARQVQNGAPADANAIRNRSNKYEYKIAGGQPSVVAVLPLVESQNLALDSSAFNQLELALQLQAQFQAKGLSAGASFLNDYVKRQESQVNTRNSVPVVTSYTDGSTFGFEIYPSLTAKTDPGNPDSSSGEILEPITFPAVVAILIDKSDLGGNQTSPQQFLVCSAKMNTDKISAVIQGEKTSYSGLSGTFKLSDIEASFPPGAEFITNGSGAFVVTNLANINFDERTAAGQGTFQLTNIPPSLFAAHEILHPIVFAKELENDKSQLSELLKDDKYLGDPKKWPPGGDGDEARTYLTNHLNDILSMPKKDPGMFKAFVDRANESNIKYLPELSVLLKNTDGDPDLQSRAVRLILESDYTNVFLNIAPRKRASGTFKFNTTKLPQKPSDRGSWLAQLAMTVTSISDVFYKGHSSVDSQDDKKGTVATTAGNPVDLDSGQDQMPVIVANRAPPPDSQQPVDLDSGNDKIPALFTDPNFTPSAFINSGLYAQVPGAPQNYIAQAVNPNSGDSSGPADADGAAPNGGVSWTFLQTELRTDWLPLSSRRFNVEVGKNVYQTVDYYGDTLDMEGRLARAEDVDEVNKILKDIRDTNNNDYPPNYWYRAEQLQIELDSLTSVALGTERLSSLPSDLFSVPPAYNGPKIVDAFPHIVWRDRSTVFAVVVTNLSSPRLISAAGINLENKQICLDVASLGTVVGGEIPPGVFNSVTATNNNIEFVVEGREGIVSKSVPVTVMGNIVGDATAVITRDANSKVTSFDVKRGKGVTEKDVLNMVRDILEKSEKPPKTTNIIR